MNFDLPELTPEMPQGALCQVKVGDLKPTQNAVGFDEVNDKIARYSAKSKEDLRDYLLVHPVPVIIGNGGRFYVTDHHHLTNALWKTAEGENAAGIETKNARVVRHRTVQSCEPDGLSLLEGDAGETAGLPVRQLRRRSDPPEGLVHAHEGPGQ